MTEEKKNVLNSFEWYSIEPKEQFFDQLERRIFINVTEQPLKVGFGHNTRMVEMIAIGAGVAKDPVLEALEGEVVEG